MGYDAKLLKGSYVSYGVYECPASPAEAGRFIFRTESIDEAIGACKCAEAEGKYCFIKGMTAEGEEVVFF